jgi:hypothetical protein
MASGLPAPRWPIEGSSCQDCHRSKPARRNWPNGRRRDPCLISAVPRIYSGCVSRMRLSATSLVTVATSSGI